MASYSLCILASTKEIIGICIDHIGDIFLLMRDNLSIFSTS